MNTPDNRSGLLEDRLQQHMLYARAFRTATLACVAMAVALVASVGISAWLIVWKPEPRYFAVQQDGSLVPMVALDRPWKSDAAVIDFAVRGVTAAHTLSFTNWRSELTDASAWFTREGFDSYLRALQDSGNLDLVQQNRLNSYAIANRAVIVQQGVYTDGTWRWNVQVPLTIVYESASERSEQEILGTVIVRRVPTVENPEGIGIQLFRAEVVRG